MSQRIGGILWGDGDFCHPLDATEHFLCAGATGSGKTTLINRLLWSLLGNKNTRLDPHFRMVINDPKQEVIPILSGLLEGRRGAQDRVRILHPFDTRAYSWDMAADITSLVQAQQIASILVPEGKEGKEPFWEQAVRNLLTAVICAFMECTPNEGAWTFRDVILTMLHEPYLLHMLGMNRRDGRPFPLTQKELRIIKMKDSRFLTNLGATLNTLLGGYEPIAAVWDKARLEGRSFSVREWKNSDQIVVLGSDEEARVALTTVNKVLFALMSQAVLSKSDINQGRKDYNGADLSWFVLDEVKEMGYLADLPRFMTKGRSKGAAVVLGFQDIAGLKIQYGEDAAKELTGQCHNIAVLKLNNSETAEWAKNLFGEEFTYETSYQRSLGADGIPSFGSQSQPVVRSFVQTSDFLYLPHTGVKDGLHCYRKYPAMDLSKGLGIHLDWWDDIHAYLPRKTTLGAFESRDSQDQYLEFWDDKDEARLGFTAPSEAIPADLTFSQRGSEEMPLPDIAK